MNQTKPNQIDEPLTLKILYNIQSAEIYILPVLSGKNRYVDYTKESGQFKLVTKKSG